MQSPRPWTALLCGILLLALAGCGEKPVTQEEYNSRVVTFPNGTKIRAEVAMYPADVQRGMKYRDSLAADKGMLFLHGKPGSYRYWMYEVRIPLDLVWLNENRQIVQIVHSAPPCPGPENVCPAYGGAFPAVYVLEVPAGTVAKNKLKPGMTLEF
jgi:uncharacterized membrane protein (UPF0127 family)